MVELPKDATGCEIPLATTLLYEKYGREVTVYDCKYDPGVKEWGVDAIQGIRLAAGLYLTPSDNREKLEKDLGRCISASDICRYCSKAGLMCKDCEINESGRDMGCEAMVFNSIRQRICNLRGETHDR